MFASLLSMFPTVSAVSIPATAAALRRANEAARRSHARKLRAEAPRARKRGDHERALQIYLQLLALEPDDGFHPLHAGDCLSRAGRHEQALDCYREAALRFRASGHDTRAAAVERITTRLGERAASTH